MFYKNQLLDELPPAAVNVCRSVYDGYRGRNFNFLSQVWISITAFLHFIGQGESVKEDQAERIG